MGSVCHCITFFFNLYHQAPKQLHSLVLNSRWWLRGPGQQETSAWHKHTLCLCCRKVTCRTQQWLFFDITNMLQYIGVVGVIDYKNLHFRVMSFFLYVSQCFLLAVILMVLLGSTCRWPPEVVGEELRESFARCSRSWRERKQLQRRNEGLEKYVESNGPVAASTSCFFVKNSFFGRLQ